MATTFHLKSLRIRFPMVNIDLANESFSSGMSWVKLRLGHVRVN